jgi:hypothetical protein
MVAGSLETVKLVSDVASNVVTIAAVLVGAVWAYWAFLRERTRWPKATVELILTHRELSAEHTLLNAKVKIHNAGRGLMKLTRIRVDISQVLPLSDKDQKKLTADCSKPKDKRQANWRFLDGARSLWGGKPESDPEPEIEPEENDEFGYDFIVPSTLETVYVYVYIENAKKRGKQLGWSVTNYYDLEGKAGGESAVNVVARESTLSQTVKEAV